MKNNYVFRNNIFSEEYGSILHFFDSLTMSGLLGYTWILIHASTLMYCHMLFWLNCLKKTQLTEICIIGKERDILINFSGSCEYSFLISLQNLTRGNFLKIS